MSDQHFIPEVDLVDTDRLVPYVNNARTHSNEQVDQIAASIQEFGFLNPILVDGENGIIAGHGRLMAAKKLGLEAVPVIELAHLSKAQKKALVIADNKLALNAGWDEELLAVELEELQGLEFDLDLLGFEPDELGDFFASGGFGAGIGDGNDEENQSEQSDGSLLALLDVSINEPRNQVDKGDVWSLGGSHVLCCCSVMTDWSVWTQHLTSEDSVFCPYPGPFVALGEKADEHSLVLVQPDPYIAGHCLDRFEEIHGTGSVKKVS